ncbi:hypothetical protein [Aureibacter tunicatorum]|uniref:Uncharacterized protein n=1 Tax=Aureibacter tunicatorum TaxID=866807 RepID=A0AAE4BUX7_9BACT|nr:hypothetical protein [Aureibacter tunicatorum]MDR6241510.1 hypothetical protein [Aureibacter tunicatorum]BDD07032.1 hypothetical protein AUTU_45150 [Aureibacter tunicatorum]
MEFIKALENFTNAGKSEALFIFLPAGLFALASGIMAFKLSSNGYFMSLGITMSVIALLFLGYGSFYGYVKFKNRFEVVSKSYSLDSKQTIKDQLERMESYEAYTKKNFYGAGIIAVLALICIFAFDMKWLAGIGTGLLFLCFIVFMVEGGFSKLKSEKYLTALREISETL